MPTNSDANKLFENNDPQDNRGKWDEMSEKAKKCPGISVFERWLEDSLDCLEKEFRGFSTQKSMRRKFGR
jgi:hypothetical protein